MKRIRSAPRVGEGLRDPAGFALLTVILALIGFTALATAGFLLSGGDVRASEGLQASTKAYFAANAGLYQYLGTRTTATDTQTYAYPQGSATVWGTHLLEVGEGRSQFRITSVGTHASRGAVTTRTVSTTALSTSGGVGVNAAFTAGAGLTKSGSSGTISGRDRAPPGRCEEAGSRSVAGLAVPRGGYTQTGGGNPVPDGSPDIDTTRTGLRHLAATGVDWEGIVNGNAVVADYTVPPDAWPDFGSLPEGAWPIIYVKPGSFQVAPEHSGRGTLIVPGDLHMKGGFEWDGLLLVGGSLTGDGYPRVEGAAIAGLDLLLGEAVGRSAIAGGEFRFHSCHLRRAAQAAFGGLAENPGSWFEAM